MIEIVWLWPILLIVAGAICQLLARPESRWHVASWVAFGAGLATLAGWAGALLTLGARPVDERIHEWPLGTWGLLAGEPLSLALRYDALTALLGLVMTLIIAATQASAWSREDRGGGRLLIVGGVALAGLLAGDLASLLTLAAALSVVSWVAFRQARGRAAMLAAGLVEAMLLLALVGAALAAGDGSLAAVERLIIQEISLESPTAWIVAGMLLLAALARWAQSVAILGAAAPHSQDQDESPTSEDDSAIGLGTILSVSALYLLSRAQGGVQQSPALLSGVRVVGAAGMALGAAALLVSPRMGQAIAALTMSGVGVALSATALGAPDLAVYQSALLGLAIGGWAAWAGWARHYGPDPWALNELARADAALALAFVALSWVMWGASPLGGYHGLGRVLIEATRREYWDVAATSLLSMMITALYCGRLFMAALLPRIGSSGAPRQRAPLQSRLFTLALVSLAALGGVWAGAAQRWLASWLLANDLEALSRLPQPTGWLWLGFFGSAVAGLLLAGWIDHRAANKWEHDRVFMERPRPLHEYLSVVWPARLRASRCPQLWPGAAVAAFALAALLYAMMVH